MMNLQARFHYLITFVLSITDKAVDCFVRLVLTAVS